MGTNEGSLVESPTAAGAERERAREPPFRISEDAHTFATELAVIARHDPDFLSPEWISDGPAMRVQMMLDQGWQIPLMRDIARARMARKRDGPPRTIRYFEPLFAQAHAQQAVPLATATLDDPRPQVTHAQTAAAGPAGPRDWLARRDAFVVAHNELAAFCDAADEGGGEGGAAAAESLPAPQRRGPA